MQGVVDGRVMLGSAVTVFDNPITYGPEAKAEGANARKATTKHLIAETGIAEQSRKLADLFWHTGEPPQKLLKAAPRKALAAVSHGKEVLQFGAASVKPNKILTTEDTESTEGNPVFQRDLCG
jgi:hypothetical protein